MFHQDNVPAHKSMVAMAAMRDCGFELIDHPPYSPDLAPSDFHLFPNMKKHLARKQYRSNDEVISAIEDFLPFKRKTSTPRESRRCSTGERKAWTLKGTVKK